jgi:Flp pilus assembly protein protease CpaA
MPSRSSDGPGAHTAKPHSAPNWCRCCRGCGGKCRHCADPITPAYPAVEIVTAALFVAAVLRFDWSWVLVPFLLLFAMLVAVSVVDLYDYRIPDRIVFPTLALSIPLVVVISFVEDLPEAAVWAVMGALLFSGILFVTSLLPGWDGFGDVKLALVLGLFLGGSAATCAAWCCSCSRTAHRQPPRRVMGPAVGRCAPSARRARTPRPPTASSRRAVVEAADPVRPCLAMATVVAVLFSNQLL